MASASCGMGFASMKLHSGNHMHRGSKPFVGRIDCRVFHSSSVFFAGFRLCFSSKHLCFGNSGHSASSQSFSSRITCISQKSEQFNSTQSSGERVTVLVIGGGGREHALCYALQRSPSCDAVFCAPGNAGISSSGNATCISDLDIFDSLAVISFCQKWVVGLVVVGPEAPLVAGLANDLVKAGIPTFGPSAEAALSPHVEDAKHVGGRGPLQTGKHQNGPWFNCPVFQPPCPTVEPPRLSRAGIPKPNLTASKLCP